MKHTLWHKKYSGRDEISEDALLDLFDPSGSLDRRELLRVLELVAETSDTPVGQLRLTDRFDEMFRPAHTRNLFRGLGMAFRVWDLDTNLEYALRGRCKANDLPLPQALILTLEEYVAVWFGVQSKAA